MIFNPRALIFSTETEFTQKALIIFRFKYEFNPLYKRFAVQLHCDPSSVEKIKKIPYLPISFFKVHPVLTTAFTPSTVFTSSGTTGSVTSRHFVKDIDLYEESFTRSFERLYGPIKE